MMAMTKAKNFHLVIFSFNQMRSIFFILICLISGVVYSYGFIGITTGELNMMTSIMAVLLIGLGGEYGIQFVTNFNNYRREGLDPPEALHKSYNKAGMGIILAALTTAIAFFVMALTGTRIFAEWSLLFAPKPSIPLVTVAPARPCFLACITIHS